MMARSALALRAAVRARLIADTALSARLGVARVFDEAPRDAAPPYVVLADVRSRDWSTSTEAGAEHTLVIDVWTLYRGVAEAVEIAVLTSAALSGAPPVLTGFRIVSFEPLTLETSRENAGRLARARLRWRASIEAL